MLYISGSVENAVKMECEARPQRERSDPFVSIHRAVYLGCKNAVYFS